MKVLLRRWDDKYYVWKNATWNGDYYVVDGVNLYEIDILAIKEDNKEKHVRCKHCGTILRDDPAEIEQHFAAQEANKDCFKCGALRASRRMSSASTYVKNDDGTYLQTTVTNMELYCSQSHPYVGIDHPNIKNVCVYYQCRKQGVKPIVEMLATRPDLFNKFITADALVAKGCEYEGYRNGYFIYDCKMRGTLKAYVNELGIVDYFLIKYRWYSVKVFYSEKYNELIYTKDGKYAERNPDDVSESKHEAVKAKIATLYKEAAKNG